MSSTAEDDMSCPICHDIFKDPVVLSCSHSFCKDCLRSWWKEKPTKECPVCKRRSSRSDPPTNLALKNLCEAFVKQRREDSAEAVCSVHSEKLKLFCLEDQQPVCVVCRDSKTHRNHSFSPIEEAAQDLREELKKSLQPLKEKLQEVNKVKKEIEEIAAGIKGQCRHTERQIQDQFKKLHQFLLEEEEARMKALREEEEMKTQRMKDTMAAVSREIEALSETIRATEEQLRAADICFLLKYKTIQVDRVQRCPLLEETQLGPGALIDQAKHLGNLAFNIWTNMKRLVQYTPVILDPNKAFSNVVLSDDLTSLTPKGGKNLVFGSEGFDSGSHSWDVKVGDSDDWALGVVTDPSVKEGDMDVWIIVFSDGEYKAEVIIEQQNNSLKLDSHPQSIRISLDCDKHELTFSDADTNSHIHSFTQICHKKLFPIFGTKSTFPLTILPKDI